ncbi:spindle pole body protein Sad1 [Schizosaccharomyces japonicus yFS275]|uniref:Spindle pole body protein Sad1 n=1 Tax=Schizosaccharomyces japonicus (strain yFS275 / FY16936) TaxID=402676 RepID=B6JW38_SCHJY|nr:spindle pole body protein Sad1 [Schizosaccharomyces japonicus yFS275]EEB05589.2 spindle pole body protein Sad1 [Schizosaccharomyces japonicus yFS275]
MFTNTPVGGRRERQQHAGNLRGLAGQSSARIHQNTAELANQIHRARPGRLNAMPTRISVPQLRALERSPSPEHSFGLHYDTSYPEASDEEVFERIVKQSQHSSDEDHSDSEYSYSDPDNHPRNRKGSPYSDVNETSDDEHAKELNSKSPRKRNKSWIMSPSFFLVVSVFIIIISSGVGLYLQHSRSVLPFALSTDASSDILQRLSKLELEMENASDIAKYLSQSKATLEKDHNHLAQNYEVLKDRINNLFAISKALNSSTFNITEQGIDLSRRQEHLQDVMSTIQKKISSIQQSISRSVGTDPEYRESLTGSIERLQSLEKQQAELFQTVANLKREALELYSSDKNTVKGGDDGASAVSYNDGQLTVHPEFLALLSKYISAQVEEMRKSSWQELLEDSEKIVEDIAKSTLDKSFLKRDEVSQLVAQQVQSAIEQVENQCLLHEYGFEDDEALRTKLESFTRSIVQQMTLDTLARPNFALLSTGARVIRHLTTPNYQKRPSSLFPRLMSYLVDDNIIEGNRPETALQSNNEVGMCWSFAGTFGQLGVSLSQPIYINAVSIHHVHPSIALDISSAPREMELWGQRYHFKKDRGYELLTTFEYQPGDNFIQTYPISTDTSKPPFKNVVLKIKSNWMNNEFTCLYQLRVHGDIPP